jgi:hypothetical protein
VIEDDALEELVHLTARTLAADYEGPGRQG